MRIKDKNLKKLVAVSSEKCPTYDCYWPRPNPGSFVQGHGYRSYGDSRDKEWICGTRDIHGCPKDPKEKTEDEK